MNLNKGIFRIWIIVIPITWIFSYLNSGVYYPNNSCEGPLVESCTCTYTLKDKSISYWGSCYLQDSYIFLRCDDESDTFNDNFKDIKSCGDFFKNSKQTLSCSKDQSLVESCESKKKDKQKEFIINMILLIIFPLTFYPIYLGFRRTFIWIKEGFKK